MINSHTASNNFINLSGAMSLAADAITHRLDESANYRPYFYIKGKNGIPDMLKHGPWDLGDMTGRYLESMVISRKMTSTKTQWSTAENHLLQFLMSLLGEQNLIWDIDKNAPDHMFAQGSALYGLVTYFEDTNDKKVQKQIERLINGLTSHAIPADDYCTYPNIATTAPCSHMAGYQIVPMIRFYELTGYEPALLLSEKLSKWAFSHDDTIDQEGVITRIGWEGHLHAWLDTLSGIIQCARLSQQWDKDRIVGRCKKTYDWIRKTHATDFGWTPDFPTSPTSETCAISSMLRIALELIREGYPEYWNDIERFTRNQLIENQFREVDFLGIRDPRVAAALSGAFDCWAEPNTLLASVRQWGKEDDGDVEGCCVNGGMRGIYLAWENAITVNQSGVFVNLLFDRETPTIKIHSELPKKGRLVITPKTEGTVHLRIPDWVERKEIRLTVSKNSKRFDLKQNYLILKSIKPNQMIELEFPVRQLTETCKAGPKTYEISWFGDTVIKVTPAASKYPIYQRSLSYESN